jgi:uncharacterized protein YjhX (UPF0386 family)
VKVTDVQRKVLHDLLREGRLTGPRGSLERLAKKGLVEGDRRDGWTLTDKGRLWLRESR